MWTPLARRSGVGARRPRVDGALLASLQALTLLAMTGSVVTRLWQDHAWLGFLLVGAAAIAWAPELSRARVRRWWFVYVAGTFVYTLLRSLADETAIPVRTDYVIEIDQFLFAGHHPVVSLQERLFDRDHVRLLDLLAVGTHWSFFIAPHAMAVALFLFRPKAFRGYVLLSVVTLYLGLGLFFLLPTTPPWLAAQEGTLPGAFRVMDFVGGRVNSTTYQDFYASLGEPNSVAAMPSIHMAITFAMYLWSRANARRWSWLLLAYCGLMAVALVYLAEHYVADLAVGVLCAVAAFMLVRTVMRERGPLETRNRGGESAA